MTWKAVFPGHLSKENNYEALAYETVKQITLGDNPYRSKRFSDSKLVKRDSIL